ncbi:hypothetical protein BS78_05G140900 [Paspalum vaginatum]|uniref:Uncharacterized protein n=1 Tax=Paspalum vaginatum TaxID=158149 RepID=A0A9W7X8X4_9POAL|nr:hypothetical protein BS78_K200300 [Paspalum vaginatum]KAJ1275507.1 hypothetical protein BS78_05G140900 [Paspalum vaginatum]
MAGAPKSSWPELKGKHADYAEKIISQDRPDVHVITKIEGHEPEPPFEEDDRVIIWCFVDVGFNFIVSRTPYVG